MPMPKDFTLASLGPLSEACAGKGKDHSPPCSQSRPLQRLQQEGMRGESWLGKTFLGHCSPDLERANGSPAGEAPVSA